MILMNLRPFDVIYHICCDVWIIITDADHLLVEYGCGSQTIACNSRQLLLIKFNLYVRSDDLLLVKSQWETIV